MKLTKIRNVLYIACGLLLGVVALVSSDQSDTLKASHADVEPILPRGLFQVPGLRDYAEESRFPYSVDPQFAQRPEPGFSSSLLESYKPQPLTSDRLTPVSTPDKNLDAVLDPTVSAKGDTAGEPHTRNRRVIVVYPDFDFEEDHHHDYGTKKGHGHGHGGYGGGYGSSTHYHPDPQPPSKYGGGYGGYGHYGGKGKKYYRRLRGPLSPILNWYYFGYL